MGYPDDYMTIFEASRRLGLSVEQVKQLVKERKVEHLNIFGEIVFADETIRALIKKSLVPAKD